jgi:hypothetical protein
MLSTKEMRVWAIGGLVCAWVMLAWGIADHFLWSSEGTPAEVVHQLSQKVRLLARGVMVLAVFQLLMATRLVYGYLRAPRQEGMRDGR